MPVITNELFIKAPIARCFDLARDVEVHSRTVPHSKERVVGGVTTGLLEQGDTITFEAVHFGLKQRLTAKVTKMEKPNLFIDEMVTGAFKSFHHTHEFKELEEGTLMIDRFDYTSPFGVIGKIADQLFLKRYMESFIKGRAIELKKIAEADKE
jgi:ligand-binding SRPBCC domain-containing protein